MRDDFGVKLIAVIDRFHLILYEAKGLKIQSGPQEVDLPFSKHHKKEKHEGFFHKRSEPGGAFEPHTSPTEIDEINSAKIITEHLETIISKYHDLIILAGPKMLGHIRQHLNGALKQRLTKEINKDMVGQHKEDIERVVFS